MPWTKKTLPPEVLFVGGDGQAELAPKGVQVTATVVGTSLARRSGSASTRSGRATSGTRPSLAALAGRDHDDRQKALGRRPRRRQRLRRRPSQRLRRSQGGGEAGSGQARSEEPHDQEGGHRWRIRRDSAPRATGATRTEDARREDVRRPGRQGRDDHRAPARHSLPPRPRNGHRARRHDLRTQNGKIEFTTSGERRTISVRGLALDATDGRAAAAPRSRGSGRRASASRSCWRRLARRLVRGQGTAREDSDVDVYVLSTEEDYAELWFRRLEFVQAYG